MGGVAGFRSEPRRVPPPPPPSPPPPGWSVRRGKRALPSAPEPRPSPRWVPRFPRGRRGRQACARRASSPSPRQARVGGADSIRAPRVDGGAGQEGRVGRSAGRGPAPCGVARPRVGAARCLVLIGIRGHSPEAWTADEGLRRRAGRTLGSRAAARRRGRSWARGPSSCANLPGGLWGQRSPRPLPPPPLLPRPAGPRSCKRD